MNDFTIDFTHMNTLLKPVHGVVNGPFNPSWYFWPSADVSRYYQEAGIPYVRLHDTNYPNSDEVDIHAVFPDFNADPDDPASYDFTKTDEYLRHIVSIGAKIHYRLGETIEHHSVKRFVFPPESNEQWAKICVGIIRHYNDGWAEGFHYGIQIWDIWEEPETKALWQGTPEEYYNLYETAARAIKGYDNSLLVGGFGMFDPYKPFFDGFLDHVCKHNVPLDYVSFDIYTDNPQDIARRSWSIRSKLNEYGLKNMPIQIAEWNWDIKDMSATYARQTSHWGATFYAAVLLMLQDSPVEKAALYAFNPDSRWSVFDCFGKPLRSYYGFLAFNRLYDHNRRVETILSPRFTNVYCCAGFQEDTGNGAILISNFGGPSQEYAIEIIPPVQDNQYLYEVYMIDKTNALGLVDSGLFAGNFSYTRYMPQYSTLELLIKKHKKQS